MPIKVRHTDIGTVLKLGELAGQSVAARREIERTQATARLAQQMEHEKEMAAFRAQLDLDAAKRSQMWAVEKMEIRSRLDFEREEGERVKKLDSIDNALRQIDKEVESGRITEEQAAPIRFSYEMKRHGATPAVSLIRPPTEKEIDPVKQYIQSLLAGEGVSPAVQSRLAATTGQATAPPGEVLVTSPTGETGTIPEEDLPEALEAGYTLAAKPSVAAEEEAPFGFTTPPPLQLWKLGKKYREYQRLKPKDSRPSLTYADIMEGF